MLYGELTDDEQEELERRLRSHMEEEGADPDEDSDHAMYLRQDLRHEILQEREATTQSSQPHGRSPK